MGSLQPKKLLIINILDILKKYSDENHRLSQKDIEKILRTEYQMTVDRKTVRRNLMDLIDAGYHINYSESLRMMPNKDGIPEESYILSNFYLEREFTDSELRLLIDSLLFSKHIPSNQCKELTEKLSGLSSQYFRARTKYISTLPDTAPRSRQLFYNIDIIDEAIAKQRQISFCYNRYGTDKKMHPEKNPDGTVKTYLANPYQMAVANGRYYLICNFDKYDNIAHIRVDRITEIKLLDAHRKPPRMVQGMEHGLDLPKHMAEHLYMFSGASAPVTFRANKNIVPDVLDWFGTDVQFFDETESAVTVRVTANLMAMRRWALQYALHAKILTPKGLTEQVIEDIKTAAANYEPIGGKEHGSN